MVSRLLRFGLFAVVTLAMAAPADAQRPSDSRYANGGFMPLAPVPPTGQPIAPFFEGWYRNADGSFTLSFGFFNLNTEQVLDIPIGPDNFITPEEFNGLQPTHFPSDPRRDRGVFEITVPAEWEASQERVVWTITANGVTNQVPGRIGYDALQLGHEPKAMGSVPPLIQFDRNGETGQSLYGLWAPDMTATVGEPLMITLWGEEVSERLPEDQVNTNVYLTTTWFKYQGPGDDVAFSPKYVKIEDGSGRATTTVTFSAPGEYVLRAKVDNHNANDSSGGDQCCWTNGYVRVMVTDGM